MTYEAILRLLAFAAVFSIMALWEWYAPRRQLSQARADRWPANLSILLVNTVLLRLLFPTALIGAAAWAQTGGFGLFHQAQLPLPVSLLLSVVLLDLAIYLQHRLFHHVPLLWRFHRVHHADLEIDVTTGGRFHPFEIFLSFGYKALWVLALGAPVGAVVVFEVVLNASSMFNHGNVRLQGRADRIIRSLLVTPDMHRIHHSTDPRETHRNFGFCLSIWDRLFGTYRESPRLGQQVMPIGLPDLRGTNEQHLVKLLSQPFRPTQPANSASGRQD